MSGLQFTAHLVHSVAWPLTVIALVLILRKPLTHLLERLRSGKGFGVELDFGARLGQAEEAVDKVVADAAEELSEQGAPEPAAPTEVPSHDPENVSDPSGTIIRAWEAYGRALTSVFADVLGPRYRNRRLRQHEMVRMLRDIGLINDTFVESANQLRELRNDVAHGNHVPTPGEALAYESAALELSRAIETLGRLHQDRQRRGGSLPDDPRTHGG